jgi:hypothetical protein
MSNKKEITLTPELIEALYRWRDMSIGIGLASGTGEMDEKRVMELTQAHRKMCDIPEAKYFAVADSPMQAKRILGNKGINESNALYGNQDTHWVNHYNFYRCELGLIKETEKIVYLAELCKHVSWMWMNTEATIVCHLPTKVHTYMGKRTFRDHEGKMAEFDCPIPHNPNGKSFEWKDGEGIYHLFGITIPNRYGWIVDTPKDQLDARKIIGIKDVDIRSAAIRMLGPSNFKDSLNKKKRHTKTFPIGGNYVLWDVNFGDSRSPDVRRYLEGVCPSKGEVFFECVDPACETVDQANFWRLFERVPPKNYQWVEPRVQS